MKKGIEIYQESGRRIIKGLGHYEPRPVKDLRQLVKGSADRYGDAVAFKFKKAGNRIETRSYIQFDRDIDCLGTALHALGLQDCRISIISENRYEWGVSYFAITNGTGVVVPMDKYLPQNEVENLIERGKVEAIFYSGSFRQTMLDISKTNQRIRYYICLDEEGVVEGNDSFLTYQSLLEQGGKLLEQGNTAFTGAEIDAGKLSIILFTSGTTSISKGVMLSHANVCSNVTGISTIIWAGPGDVHLSLLPLHHTFENTIGLMFMVHSGVCVAFCEGIRHVAQNLKDFDITILVAVPAILEAMYKKIQEGIQKKGKEKVFRMMTGVSEVLRKLGMDQRRKLFKSVYEQLSPRLRIAVSGAAALDPDVVIGFEKIGLKLIQGYGLTETSPVVAANNDFVNIPGSIGNPIGGVEVSLDSPDENGMGEIIARGPNIMLGYFEDEESTREAIEADGWFHTGDIGTIDRDGIIRITGRAKSMIVLTNGKKAFPEEYEVLLNNLPGIRESFVWGNKAPDGDIQVCAQLVVDNDKLQAAYGRVPEEGELGRLYNDAIREINKNIPQYKIIRYFILTREELVKTTKLTTKRPVQVKKITDALEQAGSEMRKASGKFI